MSPTRPLTACSFPGCPDLVKPGNGGRCEKHRKQANRQRNRDYDKQRGTAHERGYTAQWQRYRAMFLRANPLCVGCEGRVTEATVVDHIIPHKGDRELFWAPTNHQALCKRCHDRKTAKEDGGFGRGR